MTYDYAPKIELAAEESFYLRCCKLEFYRKNGLLRVPPEFEIPDESKAKLQAAFAAQGYTLRFTGKWATVADLEAVLSDIRWLWRRWLTKEFVTVLAGHPGTGKSHLALAIGKITTEGAVWPLTNTHAEQAPVLYIDTEMRQKVTQERCRNMGIPGEKIFVPNLGGDMLTQPNLSNPEHFRELANMVVEIKPGLIIVDSLGGAQSKENGSEDIKPTMLQLTKLVQDQNCACLVIHHLNKDRGDENTAITLQRLRGSSAIAQFAIGVWLVERIGDFNKLWVEKLNAAKIPKPLRFSFIEEDVMVDDEMDSVVRAVEFEEWHDEPRATRTDEIMRWVTELLMESPNHTLYASDIFERANNNVPYSKRQIIEAGFILEQKNIISRSKGRFSEWSLLQDQLPEV